MASQPHNKTIMVLPAGAGPYSIDAFILGLMEKRGP